MGMGVTGKIKKTEQNRQIPRACCRPRKPVARIQSRGDPSCTGKPWTAVDLKKHLRHANILEIMRDMQREALCAAV